MEIKSFKVCRNFVSLVFVPRSIDDLRMAADIVETSVNGNPYCKGGLRIGLPSEEDIDQMFKAAEVKHFYSYSNEKLNTFVIMDEKQLDIEHINDCESLVGSIITYNADPLYVESVEDAVEVLDFIKGSSVRVLEGEDFEIAKAQLDLEDAYVVDRILQFTKGIERITICLPEDWK